MHIDVYDRYMKMDIWLILPYDIAWDKAHSMDKELSYTWYMRMYTNYILGLILNILVYKRDRYL
jgi:hypothetical protein